MSSNPFLGGCVLYLVMTIGTPVVMFGFIRAPSLTAGLGVGAVLAWVVGQLISGEIRQRREQRAPCAHGIPFAKKQPELCRDCVVARQREEATRVREALRAQAEEAESRRKRLAKLRTLEGLRELHPYAFQELVWHVYAALGYQVERSPPSRDGGIDGIARRGVEVLVLQCKRYRETVGEPAVRDLFGALTHRKATGAVLLTTGKLSGPAVAFARGKPITLLDGPALLDFISSANLPSGAVPEAALATDSSYGGKRICPTCGATVVRRKGSFGRFWGCSRYPECRFTSKK